MHRGLFEFNPARHDFNDKTVLGVTIMAARVWTRSKTRSTLLCRQPATARFISAKLATYFVADEPPAALVDRMARHVPENRRLDRRCAARDVPRQGVRRRRSMRSPRRLEKFKDPMHFVVSSLRLAYDGKTITNYHAATGWLQQLGEPLYGRVTPDGYALTEAAWTSSGQMVRRFEIARAIGSGSAGLFNGEDNKPGPAVGFPMLTTRLFYDAHRANAWRETRDALSQTTSQQEWNTVLLASPEWMSRDVTVSRRDLLKIGLLGAAHPLLPVRGVVSQVFAAPGAADAKFLLVFLRGGYDAANVVIPVGSDFYYESRPTIALAQT